MCGLPKDAELFFRDGRQLAYDVEGTSVGRIAIRQLSELKVATLTIGPWGQDGINDPYAVLGGKYLIEVIDLVKDSEDYDPEGLLCWIVSLQRFGCIDTDHGTVISFPKAQWWDIVESPVSYLDPQWSIPKPGGIFQRPGPIVERNLPWLHFKFLPSDRRMALNPYPPRCDKHGCFITRQTQRKPDLFKCLQRRNVEDWIACHLHEFPFAGIPTSDTELLSCADCRSAEDRWLEQRLNAVEPVEVKTYSNGWAQCPYCQVRFATYDEHSFHGGVHLSCGQRLSVVR